MRISKRNREHHSQSHGGLRAAVWLVGLAVLVTAGSAGGADENDIALHVHHAALQTKRAAAGGSRWG